MEPSWSRFQAPTSHRKRKIDKTTMLQTKSTASSVCPSSLGRSAAAWRRLGAVSGPLAALEATVEPRCVVFCVHGAILSTSSHIEPSSAFGRLADPSVQPQGARSKDAQFWGREGLKAIVPYQELVGLIFGVDVGVIMSTGEGPAGRRG